MRDTFFFTISIITLVSLLYFNNWVMGPMSCLTLLGVYAVYMVVVTRFSSVDARAEYEEAQRETFLKVEDAEDVSPDSFESENALKRTISCVYNVVSAPFVKTFSLLIKAPDEDAPELSCGQNVWSTFMSLVFLALLSKFSYDAVERSVIMLNLGGSPLGSTVLAFGSQIPDTLGAVAMTKAGMADGAISSAIGSQVLQVTFGVALPWLLYNMFTGPVRLAADASFASMVILLPLTILLIFVYFMLVIFPALVRRTNQTVFKECAGAILCTCFVGSTLFSIVLK